MNKLVKFLSTALVTVSILASSTASSFAFTMNFASQLQALNKTYTKATNNTETKIDVKNQGSDPSCTGYALSYALEANDIETNPVDLWKAYSFGIGGVSLKTASEYVGSNYKIYAQYTDSINEYRALLNYGIPVVVGIPIDFNEMNINIFNPIYDRPLRVEGYHCVCLTSYDETKRAFKFVNSWGSDWGFNGYGYVSPEILNSNAGGYSIYTKRIVFNGAK